MSDTYVVVAAACHVQPQVGSAFLVYQGAPFPAEAVNLDDMVEQGFVAKVKPEQIGGLPADIPGKPIAPTSTAQAKPGGKSAADAAAERQAEVEAAAAREQAEKDAAELAEFRKAKEEADVKAAAEQAAAAQAAKPGPAAKQAAKSVS
ncbi:hypothetical protein [uncultured Jatrophihabitans sp.]|uniref:hypothetical protein n=1 Tax=uncultured Jatrophihabitans sp. TaxID=1610747 RepID=UPI0035CA8A6B